MTNHVREMAKKLLHTSFEELSRHEQRIIRRIAEGTHISRDTNREFDERLTFGQRLADRAAAFGGAWTFIFFSFAFLLAWVLLNSFLLARRAFDPSPYILLNLFLSMAAALQAPVIMMSQSRLAAKDRLDAAHDYKVNLEGRTGDFGAAPEARRFA